MIYTKKDFYLIDALNEKIEILKASGLIEFWQFQDVDQELLKGKESHEPKVLTVEHLIGCFEIWLTSCLTSFVVLIIEMFTNRRTKIRF